MKKYESKSFTEENNLELLSNKYNTNKLYLVESKFSAYETLSKLEVELKRHDLTIFAKYDHSENAREVNLPLRPTIVLVFGSPKIGTLLMQEDQSICIELPSRFAIWEDENNTTWVSFPQMKHLVSEYNISNDTIVSKMQNLFQDILKSISNKS